MAYTMTADISRMIVAGQKEIFMKNFDAFPIEWPSFTTEKKANKETETYDSVGNLKGAEEKPEGDSINYGKIRQAYQTTIKNRTVANGFEVTLEATKYDLYGVVNSADAKELARTMRELEEETAVGPINNAFTTALADGKALCASDKPLLDSIGTNDTLTTGVLNYDNIKAAIKKFAKFKNHQGGPMKSYPKTLLTHFVNQIDLEETLGSFRKAHEISNTENKLPTLKGVYSHYMTSETAWILRDTTYDHVLMQWFMKTVFDSDEDRISTKNLYLNAIAIYNSGALPNIGIVGSQGT